MKKVILGGVVGLLFALVTAAWADPHAMTVGVRRQVDHSAFTELPYGDGDLSYLLAYEYHEQAAFWQLGASYTPDVSGTNATGGEVDSVITPQLNLVFKDSYWRAGIGVLDGYEQAASGGTNDWTGVYWQFILGAEVPVRKFSVGVQAFYTFHKWRSLSDFDARDIEYGGSLTYHF
jgi:hypothetical protein